MTVSLDIPVQKKKGCRYPCTVHSAVLCVRLTDSNDGSDILSPSMTCFPSERQPTVSLQPSGRAQSLIVNHVILTLVNAVCFLGVDKQCCYNVEY